MASPLIPTLVVNVPSTGDTTVLYLTNAPDELPQHWQIGRASDCAVRVSDPRVSGHHATIRAEPREMGDNYDQFGTRRYIWMVRDNGSTNGTFQGGIKIGGRGESCLWLEIEEGDSIRVAGTKVRFSFTGRFGDDEDTDSGPAVIEADDPPTVAEPPARIDHNDIWDIIALVLTGPKTTENWVWWLFLAISGATLFLALEMIKK
jgi:hypothetical protein